MLFHTLTEVKVWDELIRHQVLSAVLTFERLFTLWRLNKIVSDAYEVK